MTIFKPNIDKLQHDHNLPALFKGIEHRNPEIRLKAFDALMRDFDNPEVREKVQKLRKDRDQRVRNTVVLRLANLGQDDLMSDLHAIIINGTYQEKVETLRILAERSSAGDIDGAKIIALALNDRKAMVQMEAIRTIGALQDKTAIIHLEDKVHDPRYTIRLEAVRALGYIGTDECIDLLVGSLTDNRIDVRREARYSLEKIGTERAHKAFNDAQMMMMVKRMNESVASKLDMIKHISKHKIGDGLPLLRKACSDEYKSVRLEALKALNTMRDRGSLTIVARMIDDPFYDIRLEVVHTLEKFHDQLSLTTLEKATEDFNKNVRDEAKRAYYALKAKMDTNEEGA